MSRSTTLRVGPADYNDFPEQQEEQELERQAHIARVTGRPWAEAPEGFVVPRQWTDNIDRGRRSPLGSSSAPSFPPSRDDAQYGPRAGNPEGDEQFRHDRARWCQARTGETFDDLRLSEQWRRADQSALPLLPCRHDAEWPSGQVSRCLLVEAGRNGRARRVRVRARPVRRLLIVLGRTSVEPRSERGSGF